MGALRRLPARWYGSVTVSNIGGRRDAWGPWFGSRRVVMVLTALMLLCGLHSFLPAHGADLVVAGQPAATAQAFAANAEAAQASEQRAEAGAQHSPGSDSHHGDPVCHQDGAHDESILTARSERPTTPDMPAAPANLVAVVVDPQARPWVHHKATTRPARVEGGRHHLVLAQISRT